MELSKLKMLLQEDVDSIQGDIINLSHYIHANPELGYKEKKACKLLRDYLRGHGFEVETGVADLETAFRAVYGTGKPAIAFMAEYDAVPEMGHACGHNIIGSISVAAGVAAKKISDEHNVKIMVLGCPAEELLGGKILMIEKGVFSEVDVALMVHPFASGTNWSGGTLVASITVDVEFWGKSSHAGVEPWNGVNALSAMIQTFNNIDSMRLHMKDRSRIAGIIMNGGIAPNVIPEYSSGRFVLRTAKDVDLDSLCDKVVDCFEAAALSTGCKLNYYWGSKCNAMLNNPVLTSTWGKNMSLLGLVVTDGLLDISATTDVGNVSVVCPTLHSFINISSKNVTVHSAEFTAAAGSEEADRAVITAAKALAMTAADMVAIPDLLEEAKKDLYNNRRVSNLP